jgi:hypothetical protein
MAEPRDRTERTFHILGVPLRTGSPYPDNENDAQARFVAEILGLTVKPRQGYFAHVLGAVSTSTTLTARFRNTAPELTAATERLTSDAQRAPRVPR